MITKTDGLHAIVGTKQNKLERDIGPVEASLAKSLKVCKNNASCWGNICNVLQCVVSINLI